MLSRVLYSDETSLMYSPLLCVDETSLIFDSISEMVCHKMSSFWLHECQMDLFGIHLCGQLLITININYSCHDNTRIRCPSRRKSGKLSACIHILL